MERNIFGCGKIFSEFVSGRMVCSNSRGYTGKNDEIEENTYIADTPGFSTFDISEIE